MATQDSCCVCQYEAAVYVCIVCEQKICQKCIRTVAHSHASMHTAVKPSPHTAPLREVTWEDKEVTVAPGSSFLFRYSTSAISGVDIQLSDGLRLEEYQGEQPEYDDIPGSSVEHIVQIGVVCKRGTEHITLIHTLPIPSVKQSTSQVLVRVAPAEEEPDRGGYSTRKCKREPILFLSTGFIYGERYRLEINSTGGEDAGENTVVAIYNNSLDKSNSKVTIWEAQAKKLWEMADRYLSAGAFATKSPKGDVRGFDMGYSRVYYREKVTEPENVPDLVAYVKELVPATRDLFF